MQVKHSESQSVLEHVYKVYISTNPELQSHYGKFYLLSSHSVQFSSSHSLQLYLQIFNIITNVLLLIILE